MPQKNHIFRIKSRLFCVVLYFFLTSCSSTTGVISERCILIDLQAQEGHTLVPVLKNFAKENGLDIDKSHPVYPRFILHDNDDIIAEIGYYIGMGRFGAQLAFFEFDRAKSSDLLEEFDTFIEQRIRPKHKVTLCESVEDSRLPVMYQ